jgi:uncharacterized protein (UPF0335 family)
MMTTDEPKYCANPDCPNGVDGKPAVLVQRIDEPAYRWRQRRTCNKACGTSWGGQKGQGGRVEAWVDYDPEVAVDVDAEKLQAFIDEIEGIQGQIDVLNKGRTDTYRTAKRSGFDPGTLKLVLRRRRQGEDAVEYCDAMLQAYEEALARVHVHGTSCDESEVVKRPFKLSEFIEAPSAERLMAGR